MTYHSDTLAFKKSELLEVLQAIDSDFSFEQSNQTMREPEQSPQPESISGTQYDYKTLLFKKPLLSSWDAASIISDTNPVLLSDLNEYEAGRKYPDWMGALNFIDSSISAGLLEQDKFNISGIKRDDFKKFLIQEEIIVKGFNDNLSITQPILKNQSLEQTQIWQENEHLKADLAKAQERIKELEQKQKSDEELYKSKIFLAESKKDPEIRKQQEKISHFGGIIDQQAKEIANLKQRLFGVEALREKFKIPETPEQESEQSEDYQSSQSQIEQLKAKIAELENEKMQFQHNKNAIIDHEITLENSDLIFISALLKMLQDEIKVQSHKSQAKILQKIEDSHSHIKGLSKSRTEKLMGKANKLYKQLNNKEMQ
ncbi:hypothetical protein LVY74_12340 [Acinetobacter sp. ME22]|uniref:hypothetical protein n=1 Tax=Acinetobacter sp. ME22 TaxID=2904802 RepID=UPI001EDC5C6F|nr:hypothetical protein [Acinetobacter sp. ME22]MCG2574339.1 hypothetical protein [Acinetobacter sp. ME22]